MGASVPNYTARKLIYFHTDKVPGLKRCQAVIPRKGIKTEELVHSTQIISALETWGGFLFLTPALCLSSCWPSVEHAASNCFLPARPCVLTSHMHLLITTRAVPGGQKLKLIILRVGKPSPKLWAGSATSSACRAGHSTVCFLFRDKCPKS